MPNWVANEKVPYVVTLLAAALGWTVQRAATVLTDAPTIAYSLNCDRHSDETVANIENLSRTRQFRGLRFHLQAQGDDVFVKDSHAHSITPFAPAMQPTGSFSPEVSEKGGDVSYPITLLEPGWKFEFRARRRTAAAVVLTVEHEKALPPMGKAVEAAGSSAANSEEPVRMVKSGFSTWIVRNEIDVLFSLTAIWLLLMILSLIFLPVKIGGA
jgi:hypothetical protein